jgi:thiol-disulfide isomerase/thioredoxin
MKTVMIFLMFALFSGYKLNAQQVRNFVLNDLQNKSLTFEELKGEKLTLIDFWASWCKPCNKAIPELNKIYSSYKDKGVNLIGINCDGPRSVSKVAPLSKALQIEYPVLLDMNSELMNDLNLSAYPTLLMVNASGKVVWIHEGYVPGDELIIIKELEKQLSKAG